MKKILFLSMLVLFSSNWLFGDIIYVNSKASAGNDGSSWQNAYNNLSVAIENATAGDEIWVAAGIYYPTSQPNYSAGSADDRFNHFTLKNGVSIYGGFAGNETAFSQRNTEANITVLSADIDRNDETNPDGYVEDHTQVIGENTYKLFYFPHGMNIDTTAVLDGFYLSGARGDLSHGEYQSGAAMLVRDASPKLVNCHFYGNYARDRGGALELYDSEIIIERCTFSGNHANGHAGGIYFSASGIHLRNCTFENNTASVGGALSGQQNYDLSVFENCRFENNSANWNAGVYTTTNTPNLFKNCSFINNQSAWGGALVLYTNSSSDFVNCEFLSNHSTSTNGGAISAMFNSEVTIYNSEFRGNEAHRNGGALYAKEGSHIQIYGSLFSGNVHGEGLPTNSSGSAIYAYGVSLEMYNTTVASNYSYDGTNGAAINVWDATTTIKNSIIYRNNINQIRLAGTGTADVTYSIIEGDYSGEGNMSDLPLFINSFSPSATPRTDGNFRLWGNSPANNAGVNTYLPADIYDLDEDQNTTEYLPYDLDGKQRLFNNIVDLGCYEQQFNTISGNMLSVWQNQHVDMGSNLTLDSTDFTVEMWFYPREGMNTGYHHICGSGADAAVERTAELYVFQNDRIHYGYGDGTNWNHESTEKALKTEQWNHIAMTYDKETRQLSVYANGVFLESLTGAGDMSSVPFQFINEDQNLEAYIDEFRVWKTKKTQAELITNMNKTLSGNEENLALYYSFDQVTGDVIEDLAGSNMGTLINLPGLFNSSAILTPVLQNVNETGIDNFSINWHPVVYAVNYRVDVATDPDFNNLVKTDVNLADTTLLIDDLNRGTVYYYRVKAITADGGEGSSRSYAATQMNPPGNALSLNGSTYVDATDVCKYNFQGATIECYAKLDAGSATDPAFFACNNADYTNNYVVLYSTANDQFVISQTGNGAQYIDGSTINPGEWHHIAITIDTSASSSWFYLDGQPVDTFQTVTEPFPYGSFLSIGQEYDNGNITSQFLTGEVDEFRVWNRPLTQTEVQQYMNRTLEGDENGLVTNYNFDLQIGKKVIDIANVFDGEIVGTPQWVESNIMLTDFVVHTVNVNTDGFSLTWNAVDGASGYTIDVATDNPLTDLVVSGESTSDTTYTITGLDQGTKYYFRVQSDNGKVSMINYTYTKMEVPGNAMTFDGQNDYLSADHISDIDFGATATIETWVYVDPAETRGSVFGMNSPGGGNNFILFYHADQGFVPYDGAYHVADKVVNSTGCWQHVAYTMNQNDTSKLYVNGQLVTSFVSGAAPFVNGHHFSIAQEFDGANTSDFFDGALDEFRIWNTVRTQEQILSNMTAAFQDTEHPDLVAYYDFDQSEGKTVTDKANGLDVTIIEAPQWSVSDAIITPVVYNIDSITYHSAKLSWHAISNATDYKLEIATDQHFENIVDSVSSTSGVSSYIFTGLDPDTTYYVHVSSFTHRWSAWSATKKFSTLLVPPGNALRFNGEDGIVDAGQVMSSNWDQLTLEAWVKIPEEQNEIGYPRIVSNFSWSPASGFELCLWDNTQKPYLQFIDQNGTSHRLISDRPIDDNKWHHVAAVYDNTQMTIYIDGKIDTTLAVSNVDIMQSSYHTGIGNSYTGSNWHPLNGTLDEIRIWNSARSHAEINEWAHKPLTGNESGLMAYYNLDRAHGTTFEDQAGNFDGTLSGGVEWKTSKALVTPFNLSATNISATGFTAKWDTIPAATNYFARVARDRRLTQIVDGFDSVPVANQNTFDATGLQQHTRYYFGAMSYSDRYSDWSSAVEEIKTTGDSTGKLAVNLAGADNYIDLTAYQSKFTGKNMGTITGWFKASEAGNIVSVDGTSTDNYLRFTIGHHTDAMDDESLWFELRRDATTLLSMGVREGHNAFLDNEWHHFAIVTGDADNRILIDGKRQELYFHVGDPLTQEFSFITNPQQFKIGEQMEGCLDELAFYKSSIINDSILQRAHKPLTGNETDLVYYFRFNQIHADTIYDSSQFDRHASINGDVAFDRAHILPIPFLNKANAGVTEAVLSWEPVDGADNYVIEIAKDRYFQQKIVNNTTTTAANFSVDNLNKNTRYYFRVKTQKDGLCSEWSAAGDFYPIPGNSLTLDGVDDYVEANSMWKNDFSNGATIETWVDIEKINWTSIWGCNTESGGNNYVLIYNENQLSLHHETGYIVMDDTISRGWHHLAFSLPTPASGDTARFYMDGKEVGRFVPDSLPFPDNSTFSIGQEYDGAGTSDFLKGKIDEFRIWNMPLSKAQIRANMNVSEPEGSDEHYIAHYTFNDIHNGNVIKDMAGKNDGTLINGATVDNSDGVVLPITVEPDNITSGSFTLHINHIESVQNYEIEVSHDYRFIPPLAAHENIGTDTTFNVTGLCPGVKYFYRVRAEYENFVTAWSPIKAATTIDDGAEILNLHASQGNNSGNTKLTWETPNAYLITNFVFQRRLAGSGDAFKQIGTIENNGNFFYIDSVADPGTYYEYTVQGLSYCYGNDTEVATSNIGFRIPRLTASKQIEQETLNPYIQVDWYYDDDFCNNIEIKRINTETGIGFTFMESADSLTYDDKDVEICVPYIYQLVTSTPDYGEVKSNQFEFTLMETLLGTIDTLDASKGYSDVKINLKWESHKQKIIDGYNILRRKYAQNDEFELVKIIEGGERQEWIDEDANPGEYYEYAIVAFGECAESMLYSDSVYSVGFRQPEGVISGQVNYEGGNPVRDVRVIADYDASDLTYGSCLEFAGPGRIEMTPVYDHFTFENGMTVEMWINPDNISEAGTLFENSGMSFELDGSGNIAAQSGEATATYNLSDDLDSVWVTGWNYVAFTANDARVKILINGQLVAEDQGSTNLVLDSLNILAKQYAGTIDEFRLWNVMRSDSILNRKQSLILPRTQPGLIAAYRFDENLGEYAFDHTRITDEPNKNHARIYGGQWSKAIPSTAKLALAGITEPEGNYQINGIWFKGSGETFSLTPVYGVHAFDPASKNMLISENSLIHNEQSFTDISAFHVTGNVKYFGADFPVEGVMLTIDGQICVNPDGTPIVTDADGNFDIEVPIGRHYISVQKLRHTFSAGFYPPKDSAGNVVLHEFINPVSGIQFIDSTFVKVAGRIVGGTIEGDKKIGFGKSNNNLGVCSFTLQSVKGYPINGSVNEIDVFTDPQTGEYEVLLYPENYSFDQTGLHPIGNTLYNFNSIEDLAVMDLTPAPALKTSRDTATITEIVDGDTITYDTVYTFEYHRKRNWIYRSIPDIEVLNLDGGEFISDETYDAKDENENTVTIDLIDAQGNDVFLYPVFTKGKQYHTRIKIFEEYINADNDSTDRVPVNDGIVKIVNSCGNYPAPVQYEISNGNVNYSFYGGFPNPTIDDLQPELSYTKTFEVHAETGPNGSIQSQWPEDGPYRAYVFGGIPTGTNFVTNGPDLVDFILRDPPGSNSHAYFEEGFTFSKTSSNSFTNATAFSAGVEIDLGWKVTTWTGFGAGVIFENEQIANVDIGVTTEQSYEEGHTYTETTTFTKAYSTSDDPLYVRDNGDLFFGHSTNISYGVSNFIQPIPAGDGENQVGETVDGFQIGLEKAINFGLEYETDFVYTQNHIENYLVPDLIEMSEYHEANGNTDSAEYYMDQANHWRKVLGENEYQKYVAKTTSHPDDKNISFDAGATYEESMTTEVSESFTTDYEFSIAGEVAEEVGFEVGGMGTVWTISNETGYSEHTSTDTTTTESTTVGYVLADGDQGDYFSIDILKDTHGNGPVFSTKGGQSSCPYEGGSEVKYANYYTEGSLSGFTNGVDLNLPTMRIEVPQLSAENTIVSGVPDNQPAVFTLKLSNLSEVDADNWFILQVDPASNPYGAKLSMDGTSLVGGMAVLVPGGTTLTKTLEFAKGRDDIFNYENVKLILHSQCQFDPTDDQDDIADTLSLSANFVPTCSNVAITSPSDNWLVNVANHDTLPVQISEYNLQHNTLEKIAYQYRPASSSAWNTQAMFFHDTTEFANYSGEKYKINGADQITYLWDMNAMQDRGYAIRAVSICTDGSQYETNPVSGILDGIRPQLFGAPSPADGILNPNDEIMVTFNEPIESGLVTYYNIDVEGVLNGTEINHGTSLAFDGLEDHATTPAGINLANNSFTLEFWANKVPNATGTVISQGQNAAQNIDVQLDSSKIRVEINGNPYVTDNPFNDDQWHHYAIVYNHPTEMLSIYIDDQVLLEADCQGTSASGSFSFGQSLSDDPEYFAGRIHDMRIWKRPLSFTDIIETMNVQLTGNEPGIFANWPMNEGQGNVVEEIVHQRHAENFATWSVVPASTGYALNGTDQSLILDMSTIPLINEMDMTVELWFKGTAQAQDAYLFSSGNPDIDAYQAAKTLGIKMNPDGNIVVESNDAELATPGTYDDDQWHHVALVVNRRAYASLFIDGEKVNSMPAPDFGSMEAAFGYIGALGYMDNTQNQQLSNYFAGNVDELRIWKTARDQEQIKIYQNTRLAGTEAGLYGYFPFETYQEEMGVFTSVPTLEDQSVDPYSPDGNSHCGALTLVGTENLSDVAPNIKRERPKQAVNFDYVINEDQIIITPTDALPMIENAILEITVKNIEDKHGNKLASPATWTAYIDKNQVQWQTDYYTFEKELEETLSFDAVIENSSGVPQPFTLSNIPSWLTVSPVSGTIQPDDEVTVAFEVAEGISIGQYNADIYMEPNSGVNERLSLDLRVYKQAPDWSVDESQFDASMNIVGQVSVQNIFSADTYDMIGVFSEDECCCVTHLEYDNDYDDYFAYLVVYGNQQGESLSYKFWDASKGKIYTDVTPEFDFQPNAIYGTMAEPILFNVGMQEAGSIALADGWKWLSFNLDMNNPDVNYVLNELEPSSGDVVKHNNTFSSYDIASDIWIGSLNDFEIGKLYRMHYSAGDNLEYQGATIETDDYPLMLVQGWNRIGYVPSQNLPVNDALAGFTPQTNDVIKGQFRFAMYDGYDWKGSLSFMEPGKGYMYKSLNNDTITFTYPAISNTSKEPEAKRFDSQITDNLCAADYEFAMSIVAKIAVPAVENYRLRATIDGEMRGEAEIIDTGSYRQYAFITVFGDEADMQKSIEFDLNRNNQTVALEGGADFKGNDVAGTFNSPVELGIGSNNGLTDLGNSILNIYPNPFRDEVLITWNQLQNEKVTIQIYNVLGEPVTELADNHVAPGLQQIHFDGTDQHGRNLDDGVYFIKFKSESIDTYVKIIKK